MRVLIGLVIIVFGEVLYDTYCKAPFPNDLNIRNTNWSIVYFACIYITMMLFSVEYFIKRQEAYIINTISYIKEGMYAAIIRDFFKMSGFAERGLISIVFMFFASLLYIDLSLINVPFDQYLISVSDRIESNILKILTLVTLLILIIMTWVKRLKK